MYARDDRTREKVRHSVWVSGRDESSLPPLLHFWSPTKQFLYRFSAQRTADTTHSDLLIHLFLHSLIIPAGDKRLQIAVRRSWKALWIRSNSPPCSQQALFHLSLPRRSRGPLRLHIWLKAEAWAELACWHRYGWWDTQVSHSTAECTAWLKERWK